MLFCELQVRAQSLRQQVNVYFFLVKILLFHYAINDGIFPFCVGFSLLLLHLLWKCHSCFLDDLKSFRVKMYVKIHPPVSSSLSKV